MPALAAQAERRLRRFVLTAMMSPFALPALGGSLLAAVAMGIHLGESSIGEVNPIYFQAPSLHPRDRGAAIDESSLHRSTPAYSSLYGWEQGHAALTADCGDCEALRARNAYAYSAQVPYFGPSRVELQRAVAEPRDELEETFAEPAEEELSPRREPIERYAYYAVTAEDELAPAVEPGPAAASLSVKKNAQE